MSQIAMSPPSRDRFAPPATARLAGRFFWKECRRLSIVLGGVGVLAALLMAAVTWLTPPNEDAAAAMVIAIGGGVMIAIAATVTVYSVEKEEGTAALLARLPRNRLATTLGKAAAVIAVTAVGTLLLAGAAGLIAGRWPSGSVFVTVGGLFLLEALVWGAVASLACPQPLIAAVLAIAAASASGQFAIALGPRTSAGYTDEDYLKASPQRIALVGVGALLAAALATRWPKPLAGLTNAAAPLRRSQPWVADAFVPSPTRPQAAMPRLLWQSARQSWGSAVGAFGIGLFLVASWWLVSVPLANQRNGFVAAAALLAPAALVGAIVFRGDQRREAYRFLAEHAGSPHRLWLARHAALLVPLALLGAAFAWLAFEPIRQQWAWFLDPYPIERLDAVVVDPAALTARDLVRTESVARTRYALSLAGWSLLAAYAWGQLASLALRSGVFAAMASFVAALALGVWVAVVGACRLSPIVCVAPLFAGPMVATLLRVDAWMFDRRGVWRWLAPVAAVVASIVAAGWWVPSMRLGQLAACERLAIVTNASHQWVDSAIAKARASLGEGADARDAYTAMVGAFQGGRGADRVPPLSDESIDRLIELTEGDCRWPQRPGVRMVEPFFAGMPTGYDASSGTFSDLDVALRWLIAGRRVRVQACNGAPIAGGYSDVRPSWFWYRWATAEDQTPERLREAISRMAEVDRRLLRPHQRVMNDAVNALSILDDRDLVTGEALPESAAPQIAWLRWLHGLAPWERERAQRAVAARAALAANYVARIEDGVLRRKESEDQVVAVRQHLRPQRAWRTTAYLAAYAPSRFSGPVSRSVIEQIAAAGRGPEALDWLRIASAADTSHLGPVHACDPYRIGLLVQGWVDQLARSRAERLRLALIAYRLENGEYPETLDAILEDPEWWDGTHRTDGVDPYADKPFGYRRDGFEARCVSRPSFGEELETLVPAGSPVLWCRGSGDAEPQKGWVVRTEEDATNETPERIVTSRPTEAGDGDAVTWLWDDRYSGRGMGHFWLPLPREPPQAMTESE